MWKGLQQSSTSISLPQGRMNCPHVIPDRCLSHLKTTRNRDSTVFLVLCSLHHLKAFPGIYSKSFLLQFILISTYPTNSESRAQIIAFLSAFLMLFKTEVPHWIFSSLSWTIPGCSVFACRSCFGDIWSSCFPLVSLQTLCPSLEVCIKTLRQLPRKASCTPGFVAA